NNASYMKMFLKAFEVLPVNTSKAFYIGVLSENLKQREPKRYLFMKETTRKIIKLLFELDREREKTKLYSWFYCLFLIYSIRRACIIFYKINTPQTPRMRTNKYLYYF